MGDYTVEILPVNLANVTQHVHVTFHMESHLLQTVWGCLTIQIMCSHSPVASNHPPPPPPPSPRTGSESKTTD